MVVIYHSRRSKWRYEILAALSFW